MRTLSDIKLQPEHGGHCKDEIFTQPFRCFGRDCEQLFKIHGFECRDNVWRVYASRIDKHTGLLASKGPFFIGYKFNEIFNKN